MGSSLQSVGLFSVPASQTCFRSRLALTTISHMSEFLMENKNELLCAQEAPNSSRFCRRFSFLNISYQFNIILLT